MSACVCCWEAEGGHPVFGHGQLFCSVNHTNPGSSLRGSTDWPTDRPPYLGACYCNNAKPPLSLGAPLLGCNCEPQECSVVVDGAVCVWELGSVGLYGAHVLTCSDSPTNTCQCPEMVCWLMVGDFHIPFLLVLWGKSWLPSISSSVRWLIH